jgi:predicted  nucleic acid-binding Zn-ribbon protein
MPRSALPCLLALLLAGAAVTACDQQQGQAVGQLTNQVRDLSAKIETATRGAGDAAQRAQTAENVARALEARVTDAINRANGAQARADAVGNSYVQLAGRVQAAETRLVAADSAGRSLDAMSRSLANYDARLVAFERQTTVTVNRILENERQLVQRIVGIEGRLAGLAAPTTPPPVPVTNERFVGLEGRVGAAMQRLDQAVGRLDAFDRRLAALERTSAPPTPPAPSAGPGPERLQQFETRLGAMARRLEEDEKRMAELAKKNADLARDLAEAEKRIATLERRALLRPETPPKK